MGGEKIKLHRPGIEPGSQPWQGCILPLDHRCLRTSTRVRLQVLAGVCEGVSHGLVVGRHLDTVKTPGSKPGGTFIFTIFDCRQIVSRPGSSAYLLVLFYSG